MWPWVDPSDSGFKTSPLMRYFFAKSLIVNRIRLFRLFPPFSLFQRVRLFILFSSNQYRSKEYVYWSQNWYISQRLGSCLPPHFLLYCPMQSSPLSSTTMMADFTSYMLILSNIQQETKYLMFLMWSMFKDLCLILEVIIDVFTTLKDKKGPNKNLEKLSSLYI